ncbi:MAG: hypothetical protein KatS3mg087_1707 [Patescibacteria group bacterium]|jgi:DNA-binding transcriptional MerR regulator|nr:MAG: hypothetical protein KatS3mg087_1707 [Patescibacteria group bacterium]
MAKCIYKTQEVADILGISKKTLLNWLKSGKIPEPKRNSKNNYREWTVDDIALIQNIKKELSKENGNNDV